MKKYSHIIFLSIMAVVFVAVPVLTLTSSHSSVSYYEQRSLAPMPEFSLQAIMDGSYFSEIESFLSDHLGGRDKMLKLDTKLNLKLSKPNVNNLIVNSDKLLDYHEFIYWDLGYLESDAAGIVQDYKTLQDTIESYGGYFCYLGLPLQSTYFSSHYPDYVDSRLWHTTAIREAFSKEMSSNDIAFINMYDIYNEFGMPEDFYYETDHHFTLRGAFAAYSTLITHLQEHTQWAFENFNISDFEWVTLENPFLGSANRKLYGLWDTSDTIELAQLSNPIPFTRTDNGVLVASNLFSTPTDPNEYITYSVYMGGDIAETIIDTDRPNLPNILIYGDSFTNPIETLLWTQANELRCIDFRYYNESSLTDYIKEYQPDIVICVRDETVYLDASGNGITS